MNAWSQLKFKIIEFKSNAPSSVLTDDEGGDICNSKVEKICIGRGPHVLIADYDNAGGEVPTDTNHQEDGVDDGQGDQGGHINMGGAKIILYEWCQSLLF